MNNKTCALFQDEVAGDDEGFLARKVQCPVLSDDNIVWVVLPVLTRSMAGTVMPGREGSVTAGQCRCPVKWYAPDIVPGCVDHVCR